jgi:protein-L-isoaspartate(D-aspartate) O-methyltransferase
VVAGDGSVGYREGAPYDAITVGAAAPNVPAALIEQLRDPGRMVIPVGSRRDQSLMIVTKRGGAIESRVATHCRFVPLLGNEGWR